MVNHSRRRSLKRVLYHLLLLIFTSGAAFSAVMFITPVSASVSDLEIGDVSDQDILAPYTITYNSDVLTEAQRQQAIQDVLPRYTSVDTNVARLQLEKLRSAMAYITSVRADSFTDIDTKIIDLSALQDIQITQDTALGILALSDTRWQTIQQDAISVLEKVMRNTIRDSEVETYRSYAINWVSLAIPADQAIIVAELAAAFVAPNSFYSQDLTQAAQENAYESVLPVSLSYVTGETVVRRGEKVTEEDIEALQHFGLAEKEISWQDYTSAGLIVGVSVFLAIIFLRRKDELRFNTSSLFIIAVFFVVFLAGARLVFPLHALLPYLFPISAYALIIAALFGAKPALVMVVPLIVLSTYGHANAMEIFLYHGIGSLFGVLIPRQEKRVSSLIWVGLSITASGSAVVTTYRLLDSDTNGTALLTLLAISILNGMISAGFTVLLQSVIAPMLGQTAPLQLLELSRPDHPLMEYLLRNAPGTYQHSLQVANLAEQAAERIGADSLLTRIGALYHDIGKAANSQFFVENQIPGNLDTHDQLEPQQSAGVIIHHVMAGVELAKKHKVPRRIQDFITEHHGTFKTHYQWTQAIKEANGDASLLEEKNFKYSGPRPQSRETALVMLADGCEARVRAKRPPNERELKKIIRDTVDTCMEAKQLDDTNLTLKDLNIIMDSFSATLKGIYHPRVEYPTLDVPTEPLAPQSTQNEDSPETNGVLDESLFTKTQPTMLPPEDTP